MATVVEWLLNYGVGLRYQKRAEFYNRAAASVVQQRRSAHLLSSGKEQWDNPAFVGAVQKLGTALGFEQVRPEQAKDLLLACVRQALRQTTRKLQQRQGEQEKDDDDDVVNEEEEQGKGRSDITATTTTFSLSTFPLGFDTGNEVLNDSAKVLRLLYAEDLRSLQTQINQLLILVQNVTANPRVDVGLGKVGI